MTNNNSILPWEKRRNPLMGIQYSESPMEKLVNKNESKKYSFN